MKRSLIGSDVDVETSLFDYGIAWTENDKEFTFYYGVEYGENEEGFEGWAVFDWCSIPTSTNIEEEYNWADFQAVCDTMGLSLEEWKKYSTESRIRDLVQYYGAEEIFGSYYGNGFTLRELLED